MKKRLIALLLLLFCLLLPTSCAGAAETSAKSPAAQTTLQTESPANQTTLQTESPANQTTLQAEAPAQPTVSYKNKLVRENGVLHYYDARGRMLRGKWKTIKKKRYYFTGTGAAATGSTVIKKKRYLFSSNGVLMKKGFRSFNEHTYYVYSNGTVATGWQTIAKKRYNFTQKGVMRTGWFTKGGKTYYLTKKKGAYTGWHKIKGKKYYFNENYELVKNHWIGSKYVGKTGAYNPDKKRKLGSLESSLRGALRSYSGTWAVYVQNLDTGESFSINNQSMYAASLIKLYALGAAYERIAQKRLSESSVTSTLRNMICISDNYSFNQTVRRVGISYINTWCRANGYTQTNQGRGLEPSGNSAGLNNGSGRNMTSVRDCGKFLASVYYRSCVSKSASAKMLNLLKNQERRWKIPAGIPSGVTVANKTGETNDYTHDAAIVYSKGADYILVVMGHTPGSGWSSARHITSISRIVYNYFN